MSTDTRNRSWDYSAFWYGCGSFATTTEAGDECVLSDSSESNSSLFRMAAAKMDRMPMRHAGLDIDPTYTRDGGCAELRGIELRNKERKLANRGKHSPGWVVLNSLWIYDIRAFPATGHTRSATLVQLETARSASRRAPSGIRTTGRDPPSADSRRVAATVRSEQGLTVPHCAYVARDGVARVGREFLKRYSQIL